MFLLLVALLQADAPAPVKGRLCLAEPRSVLTRGECRDVEGTAFAIAPADRERLFLWRSLDETAVHVGVVPPKSDRLELNAVAAARINTSITFDASRGWPDDTTITLAAKQQYQWSVSQKLRQLIVPRAAYSLRLEGQHYRPLVVRHLEANAETVNHPPLRLVPLPRLKGKVVDGENVPVPGALISFADATVCTVADVQGEFSCELRPGARTESLVVSGAGFAASEVPLRRELDRDTDLGTIALQKGQPLVVTIVRPDDLMKVTVTLLRDSEKHEHTKLQTVELPAGEDRVRFESVGRGKHLLLLAGSEPLERLVVPIEGAEPKVEIAPFRLEGTARFGDEPFDGELTVTASEMAWRGQIPIKAGAFEATMWQAGLVAGSVTAAVFPDHEFVPAPKLGANPSRWDIRIARRLISGRVFDAESNAPVRSASMQLTVEKEGRGRSYRSVPIRSDGAYEILASEPGLYTLKVSSPEHAPFTSEVTVAADDPSRKVDVALHAGVAQPLEVVNPAGFPIMQVTVLEGVQRDRVNPQFISSADDGRFVVRGQPDERRLLYLIPRDGSFAVVRLQLPRRGAEVKPFRVVIPPATGSLRLQSDGATMVLMRYNGEFVPNAIARFLNGKMLGVPASGEAVIPRLPAGTYEFWALRSRDEEERLIASGGSLRPPVRVGLSGGEQTVVLAKPDL